MNQKELTESTVFEQLDDIKNEELDALIIELCSCTKDYKKKRFNLKDSNLEKLKEIVIDRK